MSRLDDLNDYLEVNCGVEKSVTGNIQSFYPRHQALRSVHIKMSRIVGGRINNILDLNRVYVENIGNIFIESMHYGSD